MQSHLARPQLIDRAYTELNNIITAHITDKTEQGRARARLSLLVGYIDALEKTKQLYGEKETSTSTTE